MKKYFDVLQTSGLFRAIAPNELEAMLQCLGAEIKETGKGEVLLLAGSKPQHVGIVLSGLLHIVREDYEGNRTLLASAGPGDLFAEALCCAGVDESPVTVLAAADSAVMQLRFDRILRTCTNACVFHQKLIENMLRMVAGKNLLLQSRMEIIATKSIRAKVLHYLESFIPKQGRTVTIPFNREQLADFLCVERSALSHELAKMKRDGLIDYKKNTFLLKGMRDNA